MQKLSPQKRGYLPIGNGAAADEQSSSSSVKRGHLTIGNGAASDDGNAEQRLKDLDSKVEGFTAVIGTAEKRMRLGLKNIQGEVNELRMRTCTIEKEMKKKTGKKKAVSSSSSSSSSSLAAEAEKAAAEAAAKNAEKALAPLTAKTLMRTRSHP